MVLSPLGLLAHCQLVAPLWTDSCQGQVHKSMWGWVHIVRKLCTGLLQERTCGLDNWQGLLCRKCRGGACGASKVTASLLWKGTWSHFRKLPHQVGGERFEEEQTRWKAFALCWFLRVFMYLVWGGRGWEGKWCLPALFFLEKSLNHPCPYSTVLRLINKYPSCMPQAFLKLLLPCCMSAGLFVGLCL